MNPFVDIVARARAYQRRQAVPIRRVFQITADPVPAFGIAPIKVMSEEHIQAIAYGRLDTSPAIIARVNPLDRQSVDLEPFAEALVTYFEAMWGAKQLPRVWLPYGASLDVLDIFAYRYSSNQEASEVLKRAGRICRMLVEEARYDGQQVVAIAGNLLTSHAATGQSTAKDAHIGAVLPWVSPDPDPDFDPGEEAERVTIDNPASAILHRKVDDRLEELRSELRQATGGKRQLLEKEIRDHLTREALREWGWLVSGRSAFWQLPMQSLPEDSPLVQASLDRLYYPSSGATVASMSRMLDRYEYAIQLSEAEDVDLDGLQRAHARSAGRAFWGAIAAVEQPKGPGKNPCTLEVHTAQEVLRVRRGTKLRVRDAAIEGRVTEVMTDHVNGGTLITIRLNKGVRLRTLIRVGVELEWVDAIPFNGGPLRQKTYRALSDAGWDGSALPGPAPVHIPHGDLLALSERLKNGGGA